MGSSSKMRLSGLISGMDTDSIVQQLVSARSYKVQNLVASQTKLSWKQEIWKDLNSQIKSLVNGTVDNLRYSSAYTKKTTDASNANKVSITTASTAMNTTQNLTIEKLATSGYMTGAELSSSVTSGSKLTDALGIEAGSTISLTVGTGANAKTKDITISSDMTINSFITELQNAGVSANFDSGNHRIFIGSKDSGKSSDFTLSAASANGQDALTKLGLSVYDDTSKSNLESIAALANAGSARDSAIQAKKDSLTEAYQKQIEDLTATKDSLVTKLSDAATAYSNKYNNSVDLSDSTARAARKQELTDKQQRLEELQSKDAESLTAAEKTELTQLESDADSISEELADIETYETDATALSDAQTKLSDTSTKLTKVAEEAEKAIDNQAAKAQEQLNNWAANKKANSAVKVDGDDAVITLNGAKFTSNSNTITVNGLTMELKGITTGDEVITLTTKQDTSGIYDTIKNFIKQYSEVINKMDKLYNADSADKYTVLTDEEKDAMSDTEVEKWETTIKDSLLRRDSSLNTAATAMRDIMSSGFTVNGKTMHLSDFGINTLSYFSAADNEKHAYHINGDADDDNVKNETNTLMSMISTDPDAVVSFFTQLSNQLYEKMSSLMSGTTLSTYGYIYDDKKMASEYSKYTTKISEAEEKLADYEDKWYNKFSKMESTMAKLQSNSSSLTSLLGN